MNLYKIVFRHYSQKDNEEGIKELLIASCLDDAFNHTDLTHTYGSWSDRDENAEYDPEDFEQPDDSYKARMMRLGGEYFDDEHEVSDLYYGATEYGFEFCCELTQDQEAFLLANKLAIRYIPK